MRRALRLLGNRDFVFSLALVLGLAAGGPAAWTRPAALPALGLVMTLSCLGITGRLYRSPRELLAAAAAGVGLSFLVLGGLYALASAGFRHDRDLWDGLILLALAPPGVAVIPFTDSLGGDRHFSLLATAAGYLAALAITPLVGLAAWGTGLAAAGQILSLLVQLILLPVFLSRVLLRTGLAARIAPVRGALVNWSFFLVIYTIVGLNRGYLLAAPPAIAPLLLLGLLSTFGLAALLRLGGRAAGLAGDRVTSVVLLGTLKNYGVAGGLALTLFSPRAALPAVVVSTVMIVYVLWLGHSGRRDIG
jgi:BASS family bile acid:Na+ symporter